ncbi:MAG: helix-turn-helix domain-containing protein [Planctomycetota bacterium]|jgi:YesN/AraC family two-component response regulator
MKKVILMVDTGRVTGRKFLRGLERYLRSATTWQVCIANSLSYTDPQHFGRFFRQVTGQSPSEYRQSHKPFE